MTTPEHRGGSESSGANEARDTAAPPGVVFDCNLFLQAAIREAGPAFACVNRLETGVYILYLSQAVLDEIREVLGRPALQRKFPLLTPPRTAALLERIQRQAVFVQNVPHVFDYDRDPKDVIYVDLAVAAGARYLVSRDRDLLDLMDPNRAEARNFRQRFPGLAVLDPVNFLQNRPVPDAG